MEILYEKLLNKYMALVNDLSIGYPLNEKAIAEVWELFQVIDCIRFGTFNRKELNKIIKHYE